jgi:hypothetical protein
MWRVQSPMKHRSVGAAIVLGARESRVQGEGRQGIDVRRTINRGSPWESLVLLGNLAAPMKEEPMTAKAGSRQSLESRMLGNGHVRFGGGGGETQFGCRAWLRKHTVSQRSGERPTGNTPPASTPCTMGQRPHPTVIHCPEDVRGCYHLVNNQKGWQRST